MREFGREEALAGLRRHMSSLVVAAGGFEDIAEEEGEEEAAANDENRIGRANRPRADRALSGRATPGRAGGPAAPRLKRCKSASLTWDACTWNHNDFLPRVDGAGPALLRRATAAAHDLQHHDHHPHHHLHHDQDQDIGAGEVVELDFDDEIEEAKLSSQVIGLLESPRDLKAEMAAGHNPSSMQTSAAIAPGLHVPSPVAARPAADLADGAAAAAAAATAPGAGASKRLIRRATFSIFPRELSGDVNRGGHDHLRLRQEAGASEIPPEWTTVPGTTSAAEGDGARHPAGASGALASAKTSAAPAALPFAPPPVAAVPDLPALTPGAAPGSAPPKRKVMLRRVNSADLVRRAFPEMLFDRVSAADSDHAHDAHDVHHLEPLLSPYGHGEAATADRDAAAHHQHQQPRTPPRHPPQLQQEQLKGQSSSDAGGYASFAPSSAASPQHKQGGQQSQQQRQQQPHGQSQHQNQQHQAYDFYGGQNGGFDAYRQEMPSGQAAAFAAGDPAQQQNMQQQFMFYMQQMMFAQQAQMAAVNGMVMPGMIPGQAPGMGFPGMMGFAPHQAAAMFGGAAAPGFGHLGPMPGYHGMATAPHGDLGQNGASNAGSTSTSGSSSNNNNNNSNNHHHHHYHHNVPLHHSPGYPEGGPASHRGGAHSRQESSQHHHHHHQQQQQQQQVAHGSNNNNNSNGRGKGTSRSNSPARPPRAAGNRRGSETSWGSGSGSGGGGSSSPVPPALVCSPLLGEHKHGGRKPTVAELAGHVLEFAKDSHGSRYLQDVMNKASRPERDALIDEIKNDCLSVVQDLFGNYVMQNFLDNGTEEQREFIANKMRGVIVDLSMHPHGCRVVQKVLELIGPTNTRYDLLHELILKHGNLDITAKDPHATHVLQKAVVVLQRDVYPFLERRPGRGDRFKKVPRGAAQNKVAPAPGSTDPERIKTSRTLLKAVEDIVAKNVMTLAVNQHACRLVQRVLGDCDCSRSPCVSIMMEALERDHEKLSRDQHGNFILQHILELGQQHQADLIQDYVSGRVIELSQHKFGSHLVEKCLVTANPAQASAIIDVLLSTPEEMLTKMMMDPYANFVLQRAYDVGNATQRARVDSEVQQRHEMLQQTTSGRHIISHLARAKGSSSSS